ncbi:SigB/SigF/SigG family RNA polymerase sigma factor [Streptomyces sp. NPDC056464]|uniref:SigB/SigF/SigG family RNA polymerase sigma factor n=1 Tax=Streptomyces sp. NPDC056464 TaxID=3345828 RepID=UPI003682051C
MLVETSAHGSDNNSARPRGSGRRVHHDAPDTAADFDRLVALPDGPEREAIRDELTRSWLPMAHRIASRFRNRGESLEDLRQVAALGLVKAIDRYEPGRGAFESYAVPTITGEIKRHFRDRMWALRVPRRVQELRNKVRIARRELTQTSGGSTPSVTEIAAHTGLTEGEVNAGLEALDSFSTLSLDAEMSASDDGYSLADTIGGCEEAYDVVIDREAAKEGLRRLPERERTILYLRFFEDMTQSRIADQLGISQMHVSRLITRCCARVRDEALAQQDQRSEHRGDDGRSA